MSTRVSLRIPNVKCVDEMGGSYQEWFGFLVLLISPLLICMSAGVISAQAQAWSQINSLSTARSLHTATLLANGKVLVVGGFSPGGQVSASAELYDPATGQWNATGSPSTRRVNHVAARLHNGKVLIASGGDGTFGVALTSAELYDPDTGTWSAAGNLNVGRGSPRATLLADGRMLVVGGSASATAEFYDPATNAWRPTGQMNSVLILHTVTLLRDGRVLAVGGNNTSATLRSAQLYDPTTNNWTLTGELSTARQVHAATLLANGQVLVSGGTPNGNDPFLAQAELYDPATGQWRQTGSMTTPRVLHTLTLLPSGLVLAAAGASANSGGRLRSAELYDPATGNWTATADLSATRINHTATLLPNGKILAAAGSGDGGQIASAEIYDSGAAVVATVSAASYSFQTAPREIVAAFGQNLATATAAASTIPLPTSLAGTTVKITDSNGGERLAPLFFVAPGQINYQVPEGTAAGQAFVTVTNGDGLVTNGVLQLISTAPALFTTDASGTGAAAAVDAFTGAPGPFNATQASGEPNIIAFFGTGLGADATDVDGSVNAAVQASIDGNAVTVLYAGRAPGFVGLNQLNLALPAGITAGTHTLVVAREGVAGNGVTITIR